MKPVVKRKWQQESSIPARMFSSINLLLLLMFGIVALYPFWNIYVYVFNQGVDSLRAPLYLWPRKLSLDNLMIAFSQNGIVHAFGISVLRTFLGTFISLLATSTLAYAMTKRKIPGYKIFSYYFFITFMFSGGFIPSYLLLKEIHFLNTFWVLIIPGAYGYLNMVIFRSFFDSMPTSLEESAEIDGASFFDIFARLIVPLSKPVYAAIALFVGIGYWNDWFAGIFLIRKDSLLPLQSLLQQLMQEAEMLTKAYQYGGTAGGDLWKRVTPYSIRLAVVVISITPVIIVYPFLQKHFVKGMMIGAIKG